jgi:hypothetical protein
VTVIELTPDGERLALRFLSALEAQTAELRGGWPTQRERLTVELLNEISDALDAGRQPPRGRRRAAREHQGTPQVIGKPS